MDRFMSGVFVFALLFVAVVFLTILRWQGVWGWVASLPLMIVAVRCSTKLWRTRCSDSAACCSALFTGTKRMVSRPTASQIASASLPSFFEFRHKPRHHDEHTHFNLGASMPFPEPGSPYCSLGLAGGCIASCTLLRMYI